MHVWGVRADVVVRCRVLGGFMAVEVCGLCSQGVVVLVFPEAGDDVEACLRTLEVLGMAGC